MAKTPLAGTGDSAGHSANHVRSFIYVFKNKTGPDCFCFDWVTKNLGQMAQTLAGTGDCAGHSKNHVRSLKNPADGP